MSHRNTAPGYRDWHDRTGGEAEALRWLAGGPYVGIRRLAELLDVDVRELEDAWRGRQPLSLPTRARLAEYLDQRRAELDRLQAELRRPVLRLLPPARPAGVGPDPAASDRAGT